MKIIAVKIRFLGSAREVGRAAIYVKSEGTGVLFDYGVMLDHVPGFPMHVSPRDVDAIVLTHSHLDHSGAIPIFFIQDKKPVYGTELAFEFASLLIKDFIHLSSYYLPFEILELRSMTRSCVNLSYGVGQTVGDAEIQILNSGHLPGSGHALLEAEEKRLLYTSDYNAAETRLLRGSNEDYGELDALIIESTYADEDHTERTTLERRFLGSVNEVVEDGGTILVPAFSVGRSQEIACVLAAYNFEHPVTIDGMAREATRIIMSHMEYIKDPRLFMDAVHMADSIEGWKDRKLVMKKPGVIISPAGMLKGGPASFYVDKIGKKSSNAIFLVGYQIPGTPGKELLEKGRCVIDGKMRKVKAKVDFFDFSSHAGAKELKDTVKKLKGNPTIYVVHGANGNCQKFAKWINEEAGFEAKAPKPGEEYTV